MHEGSEKKTDEIKYLLMLISGRKLQYELINELQNLN